MNSTRFLSALARTRCGSTFSWQCRKTPLTTSFASAPALQCRHYAAVDPHVAASTTWTSEGKRFLNADELQASEAMLRRILAEHQTNGFTFILPFGDSDAMEQILKPFKRLVSSNCGVAPEFITSICINSPELFVALTRNGDHVMQVLDLLGTTCQLTYESGLRIFADFPEELMSTTVEDITKRLQVFLNYGILVGAELRQIVIKCPAVLFAGDDKKMYELVEAIGSFFSRKQADALLRNTPHIVLKSFEEIEQKYEYVYFHMGIEGEEFPECSGWVDLPLDEIIVRHEVLMKTGKYVMPEEKRPQLKLENPSLSRVLDTSDKVFAETVAGIQAEEFEVYRQVHAKLKEQSTMERPFERVKPSQRKKYERRMKEANESEEHEFA